MKQLPPRPRCDLALENLAAIVDMEAVDVFAAFTRHRSTAPDRMPETSEWVAV